MQVEAGTCLKSAEYMSSDESIVESNNKVSDYDSAVNASCPLPTRRKKLIKNCASWRSEEYICSLDHNIEQRCTEWGKVMILDCEYGEDSKRPAPADCPEWARTIIFWMTEHDTIMKGQETFS